MTTFYIIRHGQTNSNVKNTYLGRTDVPLNEEGKLQAQRAAERFSDIVFDAVYSSPLNRAIQTTQEITKNRNVNMVMSFGLQERDYGIFDDLTIDEIKQQYPKEYALWMDNWFDYEIPDGESAMQTHIRVSNTLNRIEENNIDKTVALVTHLGVARHIIAHLLRLRPEDTYRFFLGNCMAAVITIEGNNRILKALNV